MCIENNFVYLRYQKIFTMLISNVGVKTLKNGTIITKEISELPNSNYIVDVSCDKCNVFYKTIWSNRLKRINSGKNDLCKSCSKKGENNSQYKKNRKALCELARSFQLENPMKNKTHSIETRIKMSEIKTKQIANNEINIKSNNRGRKGWYLSVKNNKSFYFDSLLEKFRMIQLDNDVSVLEWTKNHGIRIEYMYRNITHITVPDFYIKYCNGDIFIEEVKGWVKEVEIIKKVATENYCLKNNINYRFLTQKQINKNGEYRKFIKEKN